MSYAGIIFDFDGVLVESEWVSSEQISRTLTRLGYPTTVEQSLDAFTGLGGRDFLDAVARWIDGPVPDAFLAARKTEDARVIAEGVAAVAGAVAFVRSLSGGYPKAIASSSSTAWISAHLTHIGLRDDFGGHLYSGREHVANGKPAPDLYLHAAAQLGVAIGETVIIEDSPVGVTGAARSGATVIGLTAGRHCRDGHADKLRTCGAHRIAASWDEVAALVT